MKGLKRAGGAVKGAAEVAVYIGRGMALGVVTAFRAAAVAREKRKEREAEER